MGAGWVRLFTMIRSRLAALAALALIAACDAPPIAKDPPPVASPRPPERADPPLISPPIVTAAPSASATPPAAPRFALVVLSPTQGDLLPLLRDHGDRARARGLVPVVEFHADWCPPCRTFDASMRAPEITEALEGTYLVKLDMDDWHDKLKGTGFAPRSIPSFYFITAEGRPTGKMLDGDKWGKASAARMGAALKAFLAPESKARP